MRVAFQAIGGAGWQGGYNYLLNLLGALSAHAPEAVRPVIFLGTDTAADTLAPFADIVGLEIVQHAAFDGRRATRRLAMALATGADTAALEAFRAHSIDLVFEPARFHGWRFPLPALAWIPDFQHRRMRHLFDTRAYVRRDLGFRAQVLAGRTIMLSSEAARSDCELFYPASVGRTHVVRFAVPQIMSDPSTGADILARHGLAPGEFFYLPNQFWVHKNHFQVVEALALLADRPDIVVVASGAQQDPREPTHFDALMQQVHAHGLQGRFRPLGMLPRAHLPVLMQGAVALLNPSRFEGWSTTVEEAKAAGTPMLLSDIPVHREQADGQAVFFSADDPQSLADALRAFRPQSPEERAASQAAAGVRAADAVARFARDFANVAEIAIRRHRGA